MYTLSLDVLEDCLRPAGCSGQHLCDLETNLLQLFRDRLTAGLKLTEAHLQLMKDVLPSRKVHDEPQSELWKPSHCANIKCARELFSVYTAVSEEQNDAETGAATSTYLCYCPECFAALRKSHPERTAPELSYVFQKHSVLRIKKAVRSVDVELAARTKDRTRR